MERDPLIKKFGELKWHNAIDKDKLPKDETGWEALQVKLCDKLGIKNLDVGEEAAEVREEVRSGLAATGTDVAEAASLKPDQKDKEKFDHLKRLISNLQDLTNDYPHDGNYNEVLGGNIYLSSLYSFTTNLNTLGLQITDIFPDIDPDLTAYIKISYAERLLKAAEDHVANPSNIGTYHPKTADRLGHVELNQNSYNYGLVALKELESDAMLRELMDQERYGTVLKAHLLNDLYRRLLKYFDTSSESTEQRITVTDVQGFNNEFFWWLQEVSKFDIDADEVLGMPLDHYFAITSDSQEIDINAQKELFTILQKIGNNKRNLGRDFPRFREAGNILKAIMDDYLERHSLTGKRLSLNTKSPWNVTSILASP